MSVVVTLNGIPYQIPTVGETGWGQEVTNYLVALGSGGVLTLEGGNFTLLNELNFGPTYGVASPYFRSGQDPAASTGVLRLTETEGVYWRNAADTGDLGLYVQADQLYFDGTLVGGTPLTTKGDLLTFDTAATRLPVGANGQVLIADSSEPTGIKWATYGGAGGGSVVGFTFTDANGISGSVANPTTTPNLTLTLGNITPTSVAASGAISGSNFSGSFNGTFTGTSSGTNTGDQTITLTGDVTGSGTGSFATTLATVSIAKGGTGQTTANDAFNALAPSQAGNAGKVLYTDGTNTSWASVGGGGSVTSVSGGGTQGVTVNITNPTTTPNIVVGLGAITPTSVAASGTVTGSNISGTVSGTNTGDQTITLTGDVTGTGTGTFAATLANTAVTPGTYTLAGITVDAKGRITSAGNGTVTLTGDVTGSGGASFATTLASTGVTPGTYNNVTVDAKGRATAGSNVAYLTGNQAITISGDASGIGTTAITLTLANTAVTPGTYNFATLTVDSKGRITAASNGAPVTSVSVTNTSEITGTVANPSTTPAISLNLANTAVTAGSYTRANITVDAKGRITAAASEPPQTITLTGDVTGSGTGTFATTLANTGVSAGTYTSATITVDAKGRITSATNNPTYSVAGSNTQIQYNNSGAFGASSDFTWSNSQNKLSIGATNSYATITTLGNQNSNDILYIKGGDGGSTNSNGDGIYLHAGDAYSSSGTYGTRAGGQIQLIAGDSSGGTGIGGDIYIQAGQGASSPGEIRLASYGGDIYFDLQGGPRFIFGYNGDLEVGNTVGPGTNGQLLTSKGSGTPVEWTTPFVSGKATLVAGTVTVSTTHINSSYVVQLTVQTPDGTRGYLSVGTIVNGTSFVINSTSGTETSVVGWTIFKQ